MRWTDKKPRDGQARYISKFLFFPLTLHGETRWWERVHLRQQYHIGTWMTDRTGWISTNFKN